jgi:uncharacterized membrane protein HdeD (DUF308 family)
MKKEKKVWGVILGIGFMIVGILQFLYPEYTGATRPDTKGLASFFGLLLFLAGLTEVLYLVFFVGGDESE